MDYHSQNWINGLKAQWSEVGQKFDCKESSYKGQVPSHDDTILIAQSLSNSLIYIRLDTCQNFSYT